MSTSNSARWTAQPGRSPVASILFSGNQGHLLVTEHDGLITVDPDMPTDSIVQCRKCHRYIERSPEDDEYMEIETGKREAWTHNRYYVSCNPNTAEPREFHEAETLDEAWARELPRMIEDMRKVMEGLE